MPLSKRDKKVDLTKVKKKSKNKQDIVKKFRMDIAKYKFMYILRIANFRNAKLSEIRHELPGCKFIFGKNSLMSIALGRTEEEAFMSQMHKMTKYITGQCCILLSNKTAEQLRKVFDTFRSQEFARPGNESPQTIYLAEGPVSKLPHTMEPAMRQLGLPVKLVRGVVTLEKEYKVCKRGKKLTSDQCKILKMFELQLSEFRVSILASWSSAGGVTDHEEKDAYAQITSLAPCVKVSCQQLDDGQYYFVPKPIEEEEDAEDEEKENNDEDVDMVAAVNEDADMCLPQAAKKAAIGGGGSSKKAKEAPTVAAVLQKRASRASSKFKKLS